MQRREHHGNPQVHAGGPLAEGTQRHIRRAGMGPLGAEVVLDEPDTLETHLLYTGGYSIRAPSGPPKLMSNPGEIRGRQIPMPGEVSWTAMERSSWPSGPSSAALATAARFCRAFDEIRAFLRLQLHRKQLVTLAHRRHTHQDRFAQLIGMLAAA